MWPLSAPVHISQSVPPTPRAPCAPGCWLRPAAGTLPSRGHRPRLTPSGLCAGNHEVPWPCLEHLPSLLCFPSRHSHILSAVMWPFTCFLSVTPQCMERGDGRVLSLSQLPPQFLEQCLGLRYSPRRYAMKVVSSRAWHVVGAQ